MLLFATYGDEALLLSFVYIYCVSRVSDCDVMKCTGRTGWRNNRRCDGLDGGVLNIICVIYSVFIGMVVFIALCCMVVLCFCVNVLM